MAMVGSDIRLEPEEFLPDTRFLGKSLCCSTAGSSQDRDYCFVLVISVETEAGKICARVV